MALEDLGESMEGKGWLGLLIGAAVLAPALPAVARKLRPTAKSAVKGYLTLKDKAGEWFAETGEQWQDLVAEAKAEHEQGPDEMMTLGDGAAQTSGAAEEGSLEEAKPKEHGEAKSKSRASQKSGSAPQPA